MMILCDSIEVRIKRKDKDKDKDRLSSSFYVTLSFLSIRIPRLVAGEIEGIFRVKILKSLEGFSVVEQGLETPSSFHIHIPRGSVASKKQRTASFRVVLSNLPSI